MTRFPNAVEGPAGFWKQPTGRALAVALALVALLLVGEVALRLMAGFTGPERVTVLSLGDSGSLGLDAEATYPAQFLALWNSRSGTPEMELIDLGVPGVNSTRIAHDYQRLLDAFEPDLVLLQVGVNDAWTRPSEVPTTFDSDRSLLEGSRLYGLFQALLGGAEPRSVEIVGDRTPAGALTGKDVVVRVGDEEFHWSFEPTEPDGIHALLDAGLRSIEAQSRAAGVPLVMMNYPSSWGIHPFANPIIETVARETGTPFIDLTSEFEELCEDQDCPDYLLEDLRPNARGNAVVAERIVDELVRRSYFD